MHVKKGNALLKLLVVLAVVAGGIYAAFAGFRETVFVTEVTRGKAVDAVPGSVEVFADKDLQALKIESAGRVEWCDPLDETHQFKKGDVLLKLDTTDVKRAFAEVRREYEAAKEKANVASARNSEKVAAEKLLADARRLLELGIVSKEDVVAAERKLDGVMTTLDLTDFALKKVEEDYKSATDAHDIQLKKMIVTAPMDGMVKGVLVAPDTLVMAGATVATFYSNERVVTAKISEEDFAKVKLDCPGRVQLLSYPGKYIDAKVSKILPFADADTRRYTVHLKVDAPVEQLLPNSTGEVTITVGEHDNVPLVRRQAMFNGNFVFVVKDGRVEKREVTLGFKGLNIAEVTQGLVPGEQVVVDNQDMLRHGQRVRVAKAK